LIYQKILQLDRGIPREKGYECLLHIKDANVKGVEVYKLAQET